MHSGFLSSEYILCLIHNRYVLIRGVSKPEKPTITCFSSRTLKAYHILLF